MVPGWGAPEDMEGPNSDRPQRLGGLRRDCPIRGHEHVTPDED